MKPKVVVESSGSQSRKYLVRIRTVSARRLGFFLMASGWTARVGNSFELMRIREFRLELARWYVLNRLSECSTTFPLRWVSAANRHRSMKMFRYVL